MAGATCAVCRTLIEDTTTGGSLLYYCEKPRTLRGVWEPCCGLECSDFAVGQFAARVNPQASGSRSCNVMVASVQVVAAGVVLDKGYGLQPLQTFQERAVLPARHLDLALSSFALETYNTPSSYTLRSGFDFYPPAADVLLLWAVRKLNRSVGLMMYTRRGAVRVRPESMRKVSTPFPSALRKTAVSAVVAPRVLRLGRSLTLLSYAAWGHGRPAPGARMRKTTSGKLNYCPGEQARERE